MKMRLTILCLCLMLRCVISKSATKSLTESMGQEVIEIGAPLKDLPGDLEEEPSAEKDEEVSTSVTIQPATRKEVKKALITDARRKMKDVDKIDGVDRKQEDDEARVEKELADVYKDNNDYRADSEETTTHVEETNKPILRQRGGSFKFQPDLNNPKEIERFRTSVDEISCDKSVTKKLGIEETLKAKSPSGLVVNLMILLSCLFGIFCY